MNIYNFLRPFTDFLSLWQSRMAKRTHSSDATLFHWTLTSFIMMADYFNDAHLLRTDEEV